MLVIDWHYGSAKPEVYFKITWACDSDCFPRSTLDIVGCCPQDAIYCVAFADEIIPQNTEILAIELEYRVEDKVPRGRFTSGCRWKLALAVPGARFHVEHPDTLFRLDWCGVDKAGICSSTDYEHAKPIKSNAAVALSAHGSVIPSISNLVHLVCCGIKQLHRVEHLTLLVDASIQIYFVVHGGHRVIDSRL